MSLNLTQVTLLQQATLQPFSLTPSQHLTTSANFERLVSGTECPNCYNNATSGIAHRYTEQQIAVFHALYIIIMCFGTVGNLLTMLVILLRKSLRRPIHWYTFNLAVCDVLILFVYVPTQMLSLKHHLAWTMGLTMCRLVYVVLPVSLLSTVGTLLAITVDRTRGLLRPFKWRSDSRRNAKLTIPCIWLISLLLNIPLFLIAKLMQQSDGVTMCLEDWPNPRSMFVYWNFMFVVSYAIPLSVIIVAHCVMVRVILNDNNPSHRLQNKRMISLIVALVLVFMFCTGCQHVYFYAAAYFNRQLGLTKRTWDLLFVISNFVVSLQAAINPVIYGTLRKDFKKAFQLLFFKLLVMLRLHKEVPRHLTRQSTYNSSLYGRRFKESVRRATSSFKRRQRQSTTTYSPKTHRKRPSEIPTESVLIKCRKTSILTRYVDLKDDVVLNRSLDRITQNQLSTRSVCQSWESNDSGIPISTGSSLRESHNSITNQHLLVGTPTEFFPTDFTDDVFSDVSSYYDLFHTQDKRLSKFIRSYLSSSKETNL